MTTLKIKQLSDRIIELDDKIDELADGDPKELMKYIEQREKMERQLEYLEKNKNNNITRTLLEFP